MQTGSLPEAADSDPECFRFSATTDTITENSEDFSVVLQSANNIMMSGTGAINVGINDEVTITIDDVPDVIPPTGPEVEGMYMHTVRAH